MDAMILLTSGIVESVGRSALCHVNLADERRALCQIAGRMRRGGKGRGITIAPGDKVMVKLAPPDYARGVITWRPDD